MENSDPSTIEIVHVTHPLNEEFFRRMAVPQDIIKSNRSKSRIQCTNCGTAGDKLPTCQRCKKVWYCSKECQKKHWPVHKPLCIPGERSSGVLRLVENIIANNILFFMLQVCAVIDLNIPNNPKTGFDFPFIARVDIGIEPSEVLSFVKIYLTHEFVDMKLEGMVQVNGFRSHLPGQFQYAPLTPKRMEMWLRARKDNRFRNPVGLLEIVNNDDHSVTIPFHISPQALFIAKKAEPFNFISAIVGKVEVPMSVVSCMEFINVHIRSDKQNQYKLRTEMTQADKELIRDAADQENKKVAVRLLREKMARERLYANLPLLQ